MHSSAQFTKLVRCTFYCCRPPSLKLPELILSEEGRAKRWRLTPDDVVPKHLRSNVLPNLAVSIASLARLRKKKSFCLRIWIEILLLSAKTFLTNAERRASLVAQIVKNLPVIQETGIWSLDQEDPLDSNPLQYSCQEECHGQRSLVTYSPWGCRELDPTEWLRHTHKTQRVKMEWIRST